MKPTGWIFTRHVNGKPVRVSLGYAEGIRQFNLALDRKETGISLRAK